MISKAMKSMMGASLAAGVAVALAACGGAKDANAPGAGEGMAAAGGKVQCKESNSCKGNGSCAGTAVNEKHSCKGSNNCGGNVREITKAECDTIKGTVVASK